LQAELRQAVTKSYDYMYLFLERCMQLDRVKPRGRVAALEA
jgi:pyrroloquinoline quinone (PQQ) biosynthesis protein C